MLLVLCMLLGMLPTTVLAASSASPFTDVSKTDWFYDAVQYVYANGLIEGTSANTFSPKVTTSRGMLVTILWRLEGQPKVSGTAFNDVASGRWYTDAVQWASATGIVEGYNNGKFGPNDALTREQMATILYRYASYKGYDVTASADLSKYTDANKVSSYAATAMSWANATGLITGMTSSTLAPQGSAIRAQAATVLMRFREQNYTAQPNLLAKRYKELLQQYPESAEYTLYDIDKNGIPELIVKSALRKYSIYSFDGSHPILCGEEYLAPYGGLYAYNGNGLIIYDGGTGNLHLEYIFLSTLDNNTLNYSRTIKSTEECSYEELRDCLKNYTAISDFYPINDYTYLYSFR